MRDPPRVERELVQLPRRVAHFPHRAVQPVQQRVDALLGVLVLAHLARLREVAVDVRAVLGRVPVIVLERAVEARERTGDEAEGADGELQPELAEALSRGEEGGGGVSLSSSAMFDHSYADRCCCDGLHAPLSRS